MEPVVEWQNRPLDVDYPIVYLGYIVLKVRQDNRITESLNSVIRHAIKKRKVFPTDDSLKKVVWLAIHTALQKWMMPLRDWRMAMSRFIIESGDRLDGHV